MVQAAMARNSPIGTPAQPGELAPSAWITRLDQPRIDCDAGALAGLRFAIKDNIDAAGLNTTAGCAAYAYVAQDDAAVVRKLLGAGAQLVGKTNLDQFACGLNGTRSPYGVVPNSFDARYVCGGSSSGSAYAVATGQVDFALGTDTAGSGRVPAGLNNIVGLKPSRGLISTRGVVPAARSVDCVSIFARTVATAAQVLAQAMGYDPADPYSRKLPMASRPFPASLRVGIPDVLEFHGDQLSDKAFAQAVEQIGAHGGKAVRVSFRSLAQAAALLYDSALVAERYHAIREFFDADPQQVMEPVRAIIAQGRDYTAADVFEAQTQLQALRQQVAAMWNDIDVLMVPTAPTHCTIAQMQADPIALNRKLGAYTNFVNLLDYAALSVPSSIRPDGLPFGITLIGPCGSDWQLAELGQRYHLASGMTQGATGLPLPSAQTIPGLTASGTVKLAVVGAHLSGMPLNGQLTERGATLVCASQTAAHYRLYALPGTVPPKPGMLRVAEQRGARIDVEVWQMPTEHYGSFVALIPSPLCIGTLELADGSAVQGFLCEAQATTGAQDISQFGGWRAYIAWLSQQQQQQ